MHHPRINAADVEPSLDWFIAREPLVRKLIGICEDNSRPGGGIHAAWDELVSWEMNANVETNGLVKPLETPTAADVSSAEPVKARIEADGGASIVDAMSYAEDVAALSRGPVADVEDAYVIALAAEVRRLRELLDQPTAQDRVLLAENRQLREERDLFRAASEAAELRIVELREAHDMWKQQWEEMRDMMWKPAMAKLARVETLLLEARKRNPKRVESGRCGTTDEFWTDEIEDALRDEPQPEPVRGPWACNACGHDHQGDRLANICIGCSCPETAPQPEREPKLPYNGY